METRQNKRENTSKLLVIIISSLYTNLIFDTFFLTKVEFGFLYGAVYQNQGLNEQNFSYNFDLKFLTL